jgi:hypothetical protein
MNSAAASAQPLSGNRFNVAPYYNANSFTLETTNGGYNEQKNSNAYHLRHRCGGRALGLSPYAQAEP